MSHVMFWGFLRLRRKLSQVIKQSPWGQPEVPQLRPLHLWTFLCPHRLPPQLPGEISNFFLKP